MHGHVHAVTAQGLQGYSQLAATKTSEAAAAAATRRKLLREAEQLHAQDDAETADLVREWKGAKGDKKDRPGVLVAATYRWTGSSVERAVEAAVDRAVSFWV